MAKARSTDLSEDLSPEQVAGGVSFPDIYFLAFPKAALEELTAEANKRNMTLAMALGQAIETWIKNGETDER